MTKQVLSKVVHDKTSNIHEYVFKDNDKISYPLKVIISQIKQVSDLILIIQYNYHHTYKSIKLNYIQNNANLPIYKMRANSNY
mgnify:FL=1